MSLTWDFEKRKAENQIVVRAKTINNPANWHKSKEARQKTINSPFNWQEPENCEEGSWSW